MHLDLLNKMNDLLSTLKDVRKILAGLESWLL
jgi:hypothetical protein